MGIRNLLAHKYLVVLVLLYTTLITWLSTARIFVPIKIGVEGSDKLGHFLAYIVFTLVWFLFFFYSEKLHWKFSKSLVLSSIIGFLYGIVMEACQAIFTDYRSPDWNDVFANTGGIIFAILLMKIFQNKLVTLKKKLFSSR